MSYQEVEEDGNLESGAANRLALLHLSATNEPPEPTTVEQFTICNSLKRRSPSPSSSTLQQRPSSSGAHTLHGFTKLSLPILSNPVLHRTISDPINSPGTNTVGAPNPQISATSSFSASGHFLNPQTPENVNISVPATSPSPVKATAALLPPLPPILRRSVSDPTSLDYHLATTTPPRPAAAARMKLRSPSSGERGLDSIKGESPNAKRLKRMKDRMREMSEWWDEVMHEGEEGAGVEDNNNNSPKDGVETETVEAALVERTGECLIIHFKCPCGKGYQILLSGNNLYYMLMPFEKDDGETETEEMLWVERHGEWLVTHTKCPCGKGYKILISRNNCYYKLMES